MEAKVYLEYTQEELDAQYEHRAFIPEGDEFLDRTHDESIRVHEAAVAAGAGKFDVAYGSQPDQLLDIYQAAGEGARPVVVFFHGGRWSRGGKTSNVECSVMYNAAGIHFVSVGFTLVPDTSLDGLIGQCRDAVAWLWNNAASFGGDPDRFYVLGKSSGGHVAGMMVTTDWMERGLPADLIKGGLLVSGMYNLEPVRLSFRNGFLGLDEAATQRNSSIHHIPADGPPITVAYGALETDEFRRQSQTFAAAWQAKGLECQLVEIAGRHHYSLTADLSDADCAMVAPFLERIGVAEAVSG